MPFACYKPIHSCIHSSNSQNFSIIFFFIDQQTNFPEFTDSLFFSSAFWKKRTSHPYHLLLQTLYPKLVVADKWFLPKTTFQPWLAQMVETILIMLIVQPQLMKNLKIKHTKELIRKGPELVIEEHPLWKVSYNCKMEGRLFTFSCLFTIFQDWDLQVKIQNP